MQLALFHASSGEEQQRHVIVSKTGELYFVVSRSGVGVFQGKLLTRGGRTWYREGVTTPAVKRFALQSGHEAIAKPMVAALHRFHESVQLREPGFEKWLSDNTPFVDPSDVSGPSLEIEKAQEAFLKWPLLHEVDCEYVDTREKARMYCDKHCASCASFLAALADALESCKEFGFDLEGHNARTYHGLTCLLQISTEAKDYVVDPLAEGMWDSMHLLRGPFRKADVLKIGHAIRSLDSPSLYRDFGIVVINAIDTEEAVHALGEKHSGLGKVLENAGVRETHDIAGLKQAMQTCDWRERPLSPEKLVYARCDSHYLIPLWRLLRARLLAADTFSSREEAREEEELRQIKRRLDADQQRKETAARQRHITIPSAATAAGAVSPVIVGKSPMKSPARSGSTSPSQQLLAQEPWISEWDDPEDCHRRERSRSGSFFRPDLESIHESANSVGPASAADGGGSAFGFGLENALAAAFEEGDDGDEEGDDSSDPTGAAADGTAVASANGNDGSNGNLLRHHHLKLGGTVMDEEDFLEEENDEDGRGDFDFDGGEDDGDDDDDDPVGEDDDDDEDLWEGWGEDAVAAAGAEEQAAATAAAAAGGNIGGGTVSTDKGRQRTTEQIGVDAAAAVPLPQSAPTSPTATPGGNRASNEDNGRGEDANARGERGCGTAVSTGEGAHSSTTGRIEVDAAAAVPLPLSPPTSPAALPSPPPAPTPPVTAPGERPAPRGAGSPPSNPCASALLVNGGSSSSSSTVGGTGGSSRTTGVNRSGVAREAARGQESVVLTDGVRLVWKALSRTQTAAALLWRPAPEARRQDSHNERHFRTAVQRLKAPRWSEINVRVYEEIYLWRDRTARRMDDGAAYVCPGDILIDVALAMPKTLDDLRRVSAPLSPVLGNADTPEAAELVRVVRVALGLPAEEEDEVERGAAGRIRRGIAPRGVAGSASGYGDGGFGGAWSGAFSKKSATSFAVAAVAAAVGIAVAFLVRSRPS
ncbi:unnamed protein product [Pylaiella littoralis]